MNVPRMPGQQTGRAVGVGFTHAHPEGKHSTVQATPSFLPYLLLGEALGVDDHPPCIRAACRAPEPSCPPAPANTGLRPALPRSSVSGPPLWLCPCLASFLCPEISRMPVGLCSSPLALLQKNFPFPCSAIPRGQWDEEGWADSWSRGQAGPEGRWVLRRGRGPPGRPDCRLGPCSQWGSVF